MGKTVFWPASRAVHIQQAIQTAEPCEESQPEPDFPGRLSCSAVALLKLSGLSLGACQRMNIYQLNSASGVTLI